MPLGMEKKESLASLCGPMQGPRQNGVGFAGGDGQRNGQVCLLCDNGGQIRLHNYIIRFLSSWSPTSSLGSQDTSKLLVPKFIHAPLCVNKLMASRLFEIGAHGLGL